MPGLFIRSVPFLMPQFTGGIGEGTRAIMPRQLDDQGQ